MIICHCTGVTDCAIRKMVREGATTAEDIARRSGAGGCCAPCRDEIAQLVHQMTAGGFTSATASL